MPNKCCVTNCRSNYKNAPKKTVFKFPDDEDRRKLWIRKIPRQGFIPTKYSRVCIDHFAEEHILRTSSAKRDDGTILTLERAVPKLTTEAYPSIFLGCPGYLSETKKSSRRTPADRQADYDMRDEENLQERLHEDSIENFVMFQEKFSDHWDKKWIKRYCESGKSWNFYFIQEYDSVPTIDAYFRVHETMKIEVFSSIYGGSKLMLVPFSKLNGWAVNQQGLLCTWTQFESLFSHFSCAMKDMNWEDQFQMTFGCLDRLCQDSDSYEDTHSVSKENLSFFIEQIKLLFSKKNYYSAESLLWSFQIYSTNKKTYSLLRETYLTLPHPKHLSKLSAAFTMESGLKESPVHEEYLRQRSSNMAPHERTVMLLLDEIHVSHQVTYKGGKLEGTAQVILFHF